MSRVRNTKRNIITGVFNQALGIALRFANVTAILWILGAEYQGLSSLFMSLLAVLNVADLGMESAIVYSMYKPIVDGDSKKVNALLAFYKRVYRYIGAGILLMGLMLMPFLTSFIKADLPNGLNIYLLYAIYLINSVVSYFFYAYKATVLIAHQRSDVINDIRSVVNVIYSIAQVLILIILEDYYAYAFVMPIFTVVRNFWTAYCVDKYLPQYKEPSGIIDNDTLAALKKQVGGLFINRVGDMLRNSLDNIIISSLLGLVSVAIYNNYYLVYQGVYLCMITITGAMSASVGNSIAAESKQKNYRDFQFLTFGFSWLTGWCTICMFCLYQPFMELWVGEKLMLGFGDMLLFCVYFYVINANNMRNLYVNGNGLWWELRKIYVMECVGNLVLNIVLGYYFGISGIIWASILTIFVFNFLCRCNLLFDKYFTEESIARFYRKHIAYFTVIAINAVICYGVVGMITIKGVLGFIIKLLICVVLPNLIFALVYHKSEYVKRAKEILRSKL